MALNAYSRRTEDGAQSLTRLLWTRFPRIYVLWLVCDAFQCKSFNPTCTPFLGMMSQYFTYSWQCYRVYKIMRNCVLPFCSLITSASTSVVVFLLLYWDTLLMVSSTRTKYHNLKLWLSQARLITRYISSDIMVSTLRATAAARQVLHNHILMIPITAFL